MQIWKLKFGDKINFFIQTLSTRFGQDFEVEAQARFWSWSLVSILLLILGWGYEDYSWSRFWSYVWSRFWSLSLVEMLIFGWGFEVAAWSRIWRWNLIKICWELVIWSKEVTFVSRTQPSGPLCLWQCFSSSKDQKCFHIQLFFSFSSLVFPCLCEPNIFLL